MAKAKTRDPMISFNLTEEQARQVLAVRKAKDMTTGEVVRKACEAIDRKALLRNPAPNYDSHLTVALPEALRKKIEKLADACGMKISDVVRRACEKEFERQLGRHG
jgi:hypothetical protein